MPENPTKIWIQHLLQKIKTFFLTKEVLIFSFFVLLSTAFWFMNTLNIGRETRIDIPINYTNLPNNIDVISQLPEKLSLKIKDEGKNLFAYNRKNIQPINIDLAYNYSEEGEIRISQEVIKTNLTNTLRPTTHLISFSPDTIVVRYTKLVGKKLPVRLSGNITPAPQYILKHDIRITPDSILIYCPQTMAENLQEIYTEPVNIEALQDSVSQTVSLQKIESVRFSTNQIKLNVEAEMFTEKSFVTCIKPVNFPDSLNIRTFPAEVTVTFNVGMSHFQQITPADISVVFDYHDLRQTTNKGNVKALSNQSDIFNIRIKPTEVEFILERK